MKKINKKFISFLTIFTFLLVYVSFLFNGAVSYAKENNDITSYNISYEVAKSSSRSKVSSGKSYNSSRPKTYKSNTSTKTPSSGSFNNYSNGDSNSNKNNNSTTIKPDSGSFSTTPNNGSSNSNENNNSTTIKPDSGSFSTTPPKNNSSENNDSQKEYSYGDDGGYGSSSGGNWSGSFWGLNNLFNSFRYGGFGFGYSWITSFVTILTIIIIAYIIIDLIRNRRD